MTTILAFLFVLGVLIFVHELGHFLMARAHGVRVLRFSLGFDPKIVSIKRGGTEYSVGVIPLGGFVKLAGETVDDQRTGEPDEFLSKSKWVRFQVYLAGPMVNLLLAVVLLTVTLSRGANVPLYESAPAVIGAVTPGGAAEKAGLRPGDQVVRFGDRDVKTWDEMDMAVVPHANRELDIVVVRDGARVTTRVTPDSVSKYEFGSLGIEPVMRPQIVEIVDLNGPAARAGLKAGDVVLAADGKRLDQKTLVETINKHAGLPVVLTIERQGTSSDITVVPEKRGNIGLIGVHISPVEVRRIEPTWLQAGKMSLQRNWETTVAIGTTLRGLFGGGTPMKQLMGPVAIAQMSGTMAELGWKPLLEFMAMISLNLGLMNLLPVPVMDGGQIAILGFEGLFRRDLSLKVKERILMAGMAMILTLMVTVIYNDVMRLLK